MKDNSPIFAGWPPLIIVLIILYLISPVDLVPGFGVGFIDDLIILLWLVWFVKSWLPRNRHRMYWRQSKSQPEDAGETDSRPQQAGNSATDPFEILNIRRGASENDIKHSYREMLMKYHPDRVAHLGEEFQRMAHDKVIEITKAYEALVRE